MQDKSGNNAVADSDFIEGDIRTAMPCILKILLLDRTTSQNIIWANDNYSKEYGDVYSATAQITPELITDERRKLIYSRAKRYAGSKRRGDPPTAAAVPLPLPREARRTVPLSLP